MDVFNTPNSNRDVDDYQPRANLKKMYAANELDTEESINNFSKKYIVPVNIVKQYIEHLRILERVKCIRARQRCNLKKNIDIKTYADYDWLKLLLNGSLTKLKVKELDKYLSKHELPSKRKLKNEKIQIIAAHIQTTQEYSVRKMTAKQITNHDNLESDTNDSDSYYNSENVLEVNPQ